MSMSDNISGRGSKSKHVARRLFSSFALLFDAKSRLLISEMVSSESVQKVWADLKKKLPYLFFSKLNKCLQL